MLTSGIRLGSSHFLGGSNRGSGLMRVVSPANLGRAQSGVVCPCVHKNVQMPRQGVSGLVLKVTRSAQMIPHMRQSQFPRLSLALVSNRVLDSQIPWLFLFRHCLRASGIPKPTAYISPKMRRPGTVPRIECGIRIVVGVSVQRSSPDPTAGRGGGKRVAIEGSCSDVVVRARRNLCS